MQEKVGDIERQNNTPLQKGILDWVVYILSWIVLPFSLLVLSVLILLFHKYFRDNSYEILKKCAKDEDIRREGLYICLMVLFAVWGIFILIDFFHDIAQKGLPSKGDYRYFKLVLFAFVFNIVEWLTKKYEENIRKRTSSDSHSMRFLLKEAQKDLKDLMLKDPLAQENNEYDVYNVSEDFIFIAIVLLFFCVWSPVLSLIWTAVFAFYAVVYFGRYHFLRKKNSPFDNFDFKRFFTPDDTHNDELQKEPSAFLKHGFFYRKLPLFSAMYDETPFVCEGVRIARRPVRKWMSSDFEMATCSDYGFSIKMKIPKKMEGNVLILPKTILFSHCFRSVKNMNRFKTRTDLDKYYVFFETRNNNFPICLLTPLLSNLKELFSPYKIGLSLRNDTITITLQSLFIENQPIREDILIPQIEQAIRTVNDMTRKIEYRQNWAPVKKRANFFHVLGDIIILMFFLSFVLLIVIAYMETH